MVNAGDDFQGYMQDIQKRELQAEQFTSQIENHEVCTRECTPRFDGCPRALE
jgi:hypothetical protein